MQEYIVRQSVRIHAGPEQVWDALTNPEKTKKYFFKARVFSDWKQGGEIRFTGRMFFIIPFEMKGQILEIEPGKLLKYDLKNSGSSTESIVTDRLSYDGGFTTLSITDEVGLGDGAEKRFKRSQKGWEKILQGLKKVVESER